MVQAREEGAVVEKCAWIQGTWGEGQTWSGAAVSMVVVSVLHTRVPQHLV